MPIRIFIQLTLRYEHSTTGILHKKYVRCIENSRLDMLFEFFKIFGCITTHNFTQINIITTNFAYYIIIQITLQYEYPITVIFHKT
jgi:hypothetical protein